MDDQNPQNVPPAQPVPPVQQEQEFAQQGVGPGNEPLDSRLGTPAEPRFPNPAEQDQPEGEGGDGGPKYDGGEIPQVDEQQVEEALEQNPPVSTPPHEREVDVQPNDPGYVPPAEAQ